MSAEELAEIIVWLQECERIDRAAVVVGFNLLCVRYRTAYLVAED
jgi:hypothetical protein